MTKKEAWKEIKEECSRLNGEGLTIVYKCVNSYDFAIEE